jgi:hypothetical protein
LAHISPHGAYEFDATSTVGAIIENSADFRQFSISAVIIMPAEMVDLLFFLGSMIKNSVISLLPLSES